MRKPYTQLYCHFVWATYDRQPVITPEMEPRLYGAIRAKLAEMDCTPVAIGGVADHVHCLCGFPPTVAIANIVGRAKGSSSHLASRALAAETFRWQGAYGAFTVGRDDLERVRAYILNQKQHHARNDLWHDWEQTMIPDEAE